MDITYSKKLEGVKQSIMDTIIAAGLPIKSAALVLDWELPADAASKMPQGLLLVGTNKLSVSQVMSLQAQTSTFAMALTEYIVKAMATPQEPPAEEKSV